MVKINDNVQFWLGLTTVRAQVIGFSQNNQVIMKQQYMGVNNQSGRIELIEEIYYRDKTFITDLNRERDS